MTTARWQQIEEIYQAAADLEPAERSGYLSQACQDDVLLRQEVEKLLATDGEQFDHTAESAIATVAAQLAGSTAAPFIGKKIGAYRVTGLIGSGGMGTVYRAAREDDQFHQEVAIKVLKRGMDFDELIARFRQERQILARLDHPHIARLLDGGATEDGAPYFVLELIEGVPLTDFCNGRSESEKLALLRQICGAVQYAHQNLIVHRDLKPANILITKTGMPKLLDFGLAKLLDPEISVSQTRTTLRMLTPNYASPEQIRGEAITTASDIYSLGAILYELVSSRPAHVFESHSAAEMERVVCESDAPTLPGELGNIIQMAMRKEPERRYATVEQFSDDIRRFVEGLPVLARKDTVLYRGRKFIRRNKAAAALGFVACLSLLGGIIVTSFQANRANQAFEESRHYAASLLVEMERAIRQVPGTLVGREALVNRTLPYLDRLASQGLRDPEQRFDLAISYFLVANIQGVTGGENLNLFDQCVETAHKARSIAESLHDQDPHNPELIAFLASVYHHIGICKAELGFPREALDWFERARPLVDESDPKAYARCTYPELTRHLHRVEVARMKYELGDPAGALAETEPIRRVPTPTVARVRSASLTRTGDVVSARDYIQSVREKFGTGHRTVALMGAVHLELLLGLLEGYPLELNTGDHQAGLEHVRSAVEAADDLDRRSSTTPSTQRFLADSRIKLAGFLRDPSPVEASGLYSFAFRVYSGLLQRSPGNRKFKRTLARLASESALPLRRTGQPVAALSRLNYARTLEGDLGEPQPFTYGELGDQFSAEGEAQKAEQAYREAIRLAGNAVAGRPHDMEFHRELGDSYERMGRFHEKARRWSQASEWYTKSLQVWIKWPQYGTPTIYNQRREKQARENVRRCGRFPDKAAQE